ncbi:SH3 domain-containing protein [Archangium violaceum]|uniref:SH3 domain-containing protein n=1 Tax=Archangium violaceum TaxID=83451 RepID=UPI00195008EB|nr:SH3 domain-containing protein [Archangium violaceum]QRN95437.1 SH3 domain-containing protein [Archangium violaceum]
MSRQRRPALLALVCMMTGGSALAVSPPNGTLYIKAKNTHLKASSSPTADTLEVLQPGKAVTYTARVPGSPWCKVRVALNKKGTVEGFIYQANLSVSPPSMEVTSKNPGKPLSPEAFASSAAAIKALGPGAIEYGKTLKKPESVGQLIALEKLARSVDDKQVAEYAQEGGLPTVVGLTQVAKTSAKKGSKR